MPRHPLSLLPWLPVPVVLVTLFTSLPLATAGIVHVTADPNTPFVVYGPAVPITPGDTDEGGQGTVNLGSAEQEKSYGTIIVVKWVDGKKQSTEMKLTPPTTLGDYEPFRYPTFDVPVIAVAVVDQVPLDASGLVLTAGQSMTAAGGSVPETPFIHFKDASGVADLATLTDTQIAALPNYSGGVKVFAFDSVTPVPEPGTALAVAAVIGHGVRFRRR